MTALTTAIRPHLRYLRYVLLHKLYVFRAGILVNGYSLPWLWRLLVHDLSKFSRAEWSPYVDRFYGPQVTDGNTVHRREVERRFNAAWLHHIHHNPHHWQHWILHEDSGKTLVLVPPNAEANEMIADWLGAGTKVLRWPSMAECIAETIAWYAKGAGANMQLRGPVRKHVEMVLFALAEKYGIAKAAGVRTGFATVTVGPDGRGA